MCFSTIVIKAVAAKNFSLEFCLFYSNQYFLIANMSSSEDEQLNEEVSAEESDGGTDNENDDNQNRVSILLAQLTCFLNYFFGLLLKKNHPILHSL